MKKVVKEYEVYTYDELSQEAKEKVKQSFINDEIRNDIFHEMVSDDLGHYFKNSELKVQYSLGYCQGDGLNIYGSLRYDDVLLNLESDDPIIEESFTEKEKRTLDFYFEEYGPYIDLEYNRRCCYSIIDGLDIYDDMVYVLESNCIRNINHDVIMKYESTVKIMIDRLNTRYEESGYDYLYNIDDEEIRETCKANAYEFLEDGSLF